MPFYLFVIPILFNLLFVIFFSKIEKIIPIFDEPNKERKLHQNKVSVLGGLLIYFNLLLIIFLHFFFIDSDILANEYFYTTRDYFSFFVVTGALFLFGIYDDKYDLHPNKKLLTTTLIVLSATLIDKNLMITRIWFSFNPQPIFLYEFSTFFTVICILIFMNAFNMFDGVNLQSGIYSSVIFLIFYKYDILPIFSIFLLICLASFLILNFKNKIFLGNSGSFLLSFLLALIFIKSTNLKDVFKADEILLIMLIPGLEMIRLFFYRLMIRQNPFRGDRRHIHHYLMKKYNPILCQLIIQSTILIPIIFYYFYESFFISLSIGVVLYTSILLKHYVKESS